MQLKTQTLVGDYEFISRGDPALDQTAEGFAEAYERAKETGDFSQVPRREGGGEPAVWRFRQLRPTQRAWLGDQLARSDGGLLQVGLHAVALTLVGVRGFQGPAGGELDIKRAADPERRGWPAVIEEQMAFLEDAGILPELTEGAAQRPRKG
jgi:hypothetical protein